jgi:hypothetical protein
MWVAAASSGIGPYEAFLALDWLGPVERVQNPQPNRDMATFRQGRSKVNSILRLWRLVWIIQASFGIVSGHSMNDLLAWLLIAGLVSLFIRRPTRISGR